MTNATRAIVKALDIKDSITLNIAGPDVFSLRQIAEMAGECLGKTPVFEFQDTEPKNLIANIDGMKTILAAPTISLREGIKELIS